jgi:hypothetical protein
VFSLDEREFDDSMAERLLILPINQEFDYSGSIEIG